MQAPNCSAAWRQRRIFSGALPSHCAWDACLQPPFLPGHADTLDGAGGGWRLAVKHFFNQRGARLSAVDYHGPSGMLVAAFSNGVFDLYEVRLMRLHLACLLAYHIC